MTTKHRTNKAFRLSMQFMNLFNIDTVLQTSGLIQSVLWFNNVLNIEAVMLTRTQVARSRPRTFLINDKGKATQKLESNQETSAQWHNA